MKRMSTVVVLWMVFVLSAGAQDGPSIGVLATPEAYLPIGEKASNYSFGLGGRVEGLLGLPASTVITPSLDAGYAFVPLNLAEDGFLASSNLTLLRGGLGMRAVFPAGDRFSFFVRAHASGFFASLGGEADGDALGIAAGGDGGLGVLLSPSVGLQVAGGYTSYIDLYDAVSISIGTTVRLSGPGNRAIPRADFAPAGVGPAEGYIRFGAIEVDRVFPVLYKYYDDHPIGRATVVNTGSKPVEDVEVRFSLNQFMDAPKVSARIEALEPGEEREIDIYALFTEDILSVTEGAKVAAELSATYRVSERSGADGEVVTLDTYDRNALRWDDDHKVAAFVTARDEEVQRFSRNIASVVDDEGIDAVARELQLAMVFLAALDEHRCSYVVDPSSPYFELSRDQQAVDSVQFPRQTLQYRAGDCDDLSATYAALLESAGVPTAFITVPGHIYMALNLEMSPEQARATFSRADDVIVSDDNGVWMPIETTLLKEGFLTAWAEGARTWRKHHEEGTAKIFTTRDAWKTYEPVAFGVSDYAVDIPRREDVSASFRAELDRFVNRQIAERETSLLRRIAQNPGDARSRNRLGVLYARYGRYADAEEQFRAATAGRPYVPALINLANIAFLNGEHSAARSAYERALATDPENKAAALGIARVEYASENYEAAESAYARLSRLSPELAARFSYLAAETSVGERAADAARLRSVVVWDEE